MTFYSTSRQSPDLGFGQAVIRGLAPDNGLYFPQEIPQLPTDFFKRMRGMSLPEIGVEALWPFVQADLKRADFEALVHEVLNFPIPLVEVEEDIYSLELFHGPTCAFKDVGARFMSRSLAAVSDREVTVLVATSGDTGSAVANGFYNVPGVEVVLLFPSGKISEIQERQLTTMGGNVTALEVDGVFDDCQHMVKQAFLDDALREKHGLTSANSINVARWLPQMTYYFWAVAQAPERPVTIAVPSGNFGNLSAGMLGAEMGLPVLQFIAATNANHVVPDFLSGEPYSPRPSVPTLSNAMDVGAPSNFVRMQHLYGESDFALASDLQGFWMDDEATLEVMKAVYDRTGYTLDPHGAIGYEALKMRPEGSVGIFLETAHPAKFGDVVERATGAAPELPERLAVVLDKTPESVRIGNQPEDLRAYLESR